MKYKDWPYIKGDKQILALAKAYEFNKKELDKCKKENNKLKKRYETEIKND